MKKGIICETLTKTEAVRMAEKAIEERAKRVSIFPIVNQIANDLPRSILSATLQEESIVDYAEASNGMKLYKADYTIKYHEYEKKVQNREHCL